jgi:hypothetical protein|tara:strand:- start:279 stop:992 length:714 start_codon:yes stop_codon:yes gene_type:complete
MKLRTIIIISSFFTPAMASAITVALNSVAETTLNASSTSNNMGGHAQFHVGHTNEDAARRGLLRFDVSTIPATAIISSATLELTIPSGNTSGTPSFATHKMLTSWGEGNKIGNNGDAAVTGEATWNSNGTVAWAAPGAGSGTDYVAGASASTTVAVFGNYTWSAAGTTADVQSWVDGTSANNGWIMLETTPTTGSARRFSANAAPTLTIEYTVVPEPTSAALLGLGGIALLMRRRKP